jgi:hypothetical protein
MSDRTREICEALVLLLSWMLDQAEDLTPQQEERIRELRRELL